MKPQIIIGIDTGVNTGFCVYNTATKKIIHLASTQIHTAILAVNLWFEEHGKNLLVRVEDARLRTWVPYQKNEKWERGAAAGAGSVKRDAKIWNDFLKDKGIPYEMVAPKNNATKLDAERFKKITKWDGKTNEHMRDAGMLTFGF